LTPQHTLELHAPDPPKRPSRKGRNVGAKWEFTDDELVRLVNALPHRRDQVMLRLGCYLGFRISELLSLTLADCLDEQGNIRDVVVMPSARLKGGKPSTPKVYRRPEGHEAGKCHCRDCQLAEGTIQPKPRRPPEDLPKFLSPGAKALIRSLLDRLAKTRTGLTDRRRYLFESRKTAKGQSRPISRQQAWHVIKTAAKRAGLEHIDRAGTHSMRKTGAMKILKVTNDMKKVQVFLGHRSQSTSEHYIRHDSREVFEAMRQVAMTMFADLEQGHAA
jgi:integrase